MIYIKTNQNHKLVYIHYAWDDEKYGLHKTKEELEKTGYFVNEIPEEPQKEGFSQILYYTKEKGFWFEYEQMTNNEYGISDELLSRIKADTVNEIVQEVSTYDNTTATN